MEEQLAPKDFVCLTCALASCLRHAMTSVVQRTEYHILEMLQDPHNGLIGAAENPTRDHAKQYPEHVIVRRHRFTEA